MPLPAAGARVRSSDWTTVFPVGVDAWAPYTPTWYYSATPVTLGNGTITGAYTRIGRTVFFRIHATWGSTTSSGAGAFQFTAPAIATNTGWAGGCRIIDAAPAVQYYRHAFVNSGNLIALSAEGASSFVQSTVPITFATGDQILINGHFEATT